MRFIRLATDAADARTMGGKGAALAEMTRAGMPVPGFFAVTPEAFEASMSGEQREALRRAATAEEIRRAVEAVTPAAEVVEEIAAALKTLCGDGALGAADAPAVAVAVRSSGVDEDGSAHSFAGQFESYLCVPAERVAERVRDVWRSAFAARVVEYRREHGLTLLPVAPAVLVQRMVNAEVAGVAFGADPVSGQRSVVVVSAVPGLGTALVGGEADSDTWRVDRGGTIVERKIARKTVAHRAGEGASSGPARSAEGVEVVAVSSGDAEKPALTDDQVLAVADLARRASRHFGRPQDIEWAIEGDKLYLLQSRPITSLAVRPDPDGVRNIWDNSNIAESYSGITTPLTFSFARKAYEGVYRQFCILMHVPRATIAANDEMFRQMLGLIRGRVYYNLLNWYRLIAMMPGFAANRRFMEQMMGVREGLPDDLAEQVSAATWGARQRDRLRLVGTAAGLVMGHFTLPRQIRRFYRRLDEALAKPEPPLEQMRLDELTREFQKLETKLLKNWDAPLVNDFLAMTFFGMIGKLAGKWCGNASLHNDLIAEEGGIISAEPARRIMEMGRMAATDGKLVDVLCDGTPEAARQTMAGSGNSVLASAYAAYIDKFADRCLEELKLESQTLADDPTPLLRSIGHTARRLREGSGDGGSARGPSPRQIAENAVAKALAGHPLRRHVFAWVLKHARARVRDRENLRFERTRLFGRVRRILLEAGTRLAAEGQLDDPRDVFYLEVDEVVGFVAGTSTTTDLRGLARVRREEFEGYRKQPAPAERFETRGAVYVANGFTRAAPPSTAFGPAAAGGEGEIRGTGCCPGIVRGPVRVIHDPASAKLAHGEILVAERTDPGWIMLFPSAAGILVERGSLLSHSAIVAREMRIPAIVSIAGLTAKLETGQWVEMDGSTGVVRKIAAPAEAGKELAEATR